MEITLKPTYKQHLAYEALKNPEIDTIFLGGGAGGGKSWWLCESRLLNAVRYPGYKSFIGREELKRLMQSTYVTWTKVCAFHKIPKNSWKLNGQYNYIEFTNGSRIDLLDLKFLPTDPLYERFGSLEYTDGAIEEAGEVDFMAYDVLKTRVGRHMNKELGIRPTMAITANPKDNWIKRIFYIPFIKGSLPKSIAFVQSLYKDNPHTAEEYGKQLDSMSDENNKARLKDGNWDYDSDPTALIKPDNINDLWNNTLDDDENWYFTGDIARYGSDLTIGFAWKGLLIKKAYIYQKQGTNVTEVRFKTALSNHRIPYSRSIFDEDGVGGGIVDNMEGCKGFIANSSPLENPNTLEKPNYQNLKSQCGYMVAEYVNGHKIAFAPDFDIETNVPGMSLEVFKEMVFSDLKQLKSKDSDKDGKLKIMGKDEIKEAIGRSPDAMDNFIMRMWFELNKPAEMSDIEKYMLQQARMNSGNNFSR